MNKIKTGFSLFELLVSISIIGILVAIVSVSYSSAQKKARDARRIQDVSMIQKAAEQYYANYNSQYPDLNSWDVGDQWLDSSNNVLLASFPADPKQGQTITYPAAAGGGTYNFDYITTGATGIAGYCVYAPLEQAGSGNCGAACDWTGPNKNFYCVSNQQ